MKYWWEGYDWRFIQTNLREIDMADISAERYVRDMQGFGATVAMINAAGIIASYPTALKYHYQSRFLTGDSLTDVIAACHKAGIKVIARTDFSKIRREVYEENPSWAYRTPTGQIVDYEGDVHACVNGGYQREYSKEIIRECVTGHDFDGIFFNMGGYQVRDYSNNNHGICHCKNCERLFWERYRLPLPANEDMNDPVFRKYRLFRLETVREYNSELCRFIREISPGILINADYYTLDSGMIRQESNTALDRALPHWQYSGSENTKWVRASYKNFISSNTTVDFWDYPVRHTAVSPVQQETRLWQNLANTGQLDYYLIGRLDNHADTSGYEGIKRVFEYHRKHQELYRDNESVAPIAMLTQDHWGGLSSNSEAAGLYRMLSEGHYLFDVVFLSRINHVGLSKYRLLVLPDITDISDDEAKTLDSFVKNGGKLLCTGRTGVCDGFAEPRESPALSCAGIKDVGIAQSVRGAYFSIEEGDRVLFSRFSGVNLVAADGDYIYASYERDTRGILRMIPPQPFGPPERCYPIFPAGERPGAVLREFGSGMCATIPWYPGKLFHRQGYPNTMDFVLDITEHILLERPVDTDLPPMVEITLSKTALPGSWLMHFVNQTGHFGNSFYQPVTIAGAKCTVDFNDNPLSVTSLISGKEIPFSFSEGKLTVNISSLGIFEALHVRTV